MAHGAPDWVRTVQVTVIVENEPVASEYDFDDVIAKLDEIWAAFLADPGVDIAGILTAIAANWAEFKATTGAKIDDIFDELDDNWAEHKTLAWPATQRAAGGVGKYSGAATTYQTVVTWTVATGKTGDLKEIIILSDDYDHTHIKITVGAVTWCTDWNAQGAMPIIFEDLRLAAGSEVKIEAKSTDGTTIDVDAIIVARELG